MIGGAVSASLNASVPLKVFGPARRSQDIVAAIDTGYNGALTLPQAIVIALSPPALSPKAVTLGDGSQKVLSFFSADVLWDGQVRRVRVLCVEADPLIGTALLDGYHLGIDFVSGGVVVISPLP